MKTKLFDNKSTLLAVLVFLLLHTFVFAQEQPDRPKIGLVLSGGGAKGFAHVGVLKVLEEHNIPIDYIGGTSIGSIIGGLYSVGYTADQLEEMILSQDWEALFADEPERIFMPFYEKEDQGRYLISMRFKDGKLYIPNYAITNNGIIKLFSDLTLGFHEVSDFNDLPTPFLCIAVDFETGEEVILDSGYLPDAMAASMAIPGVFPNVITDSTVFIDGGVRNNFPVDHIRAMGADIVIGVDVGAGMRTGDDLKSFGAVIDQLTTMLGTDKFKTNREDCDIYIQPDISKFSTADFSQSAAVKLIKEGEVIAREIEPQIVELEEKFVGMTFPKREGYQGIDSSEHKQVKEFQISGSRLEDDAVLGIMGINQEMGLQCNLEEMQMGLDRLHASMRFSQIHYKLFNDSLYDHYNLSLELVENSKNFVNFGAHYSTQDNVSLLFNGTFNNLILRNSRISLDLKLSEVPAVDFRYNINRGSLPGLGAKYGFRKRVIINNLNGNWIGEGTVSKNYFELNTNSVVNDYFTVGLGMRYENYHVTEVKNTYPVMDGKYNYFLYRFFFEIDTKDKAYYPTKGVKYYSHTDLITDNGFELNGQLPSIVTFLGMNQTFSFNDIYTIMPSLYGQLQFVTSNPPPVFYDTFVGGVYQPHDIVSQIPFWGLQWGEFKANNIVALGLENRFRLADKHYAYFNANAFAHRETLLNFSIDDLDYKLGIAVGYSYHSLVGPVELFFSMSNDGKLYNHVNIGYYF